MVRSATVLGHPSDTRRPKFTPDSKSSLESESSVEANSTLALNTNIQRKTAKQSERRSLRREGKYVPERDSTYERGYRLADKLVILQCHAEYTMQHGERSLDPMATLTVRYNERFIDGKPRSVKGLQSLVTKNVQLRELRAWYRRGG